MGTTKIYEKLAAVQMEYAAPKDNYNSFGGYSYRSFETMLDTLKPLLSKYGLVLTTTNGLEECGGHVYIKSTCTLTDVETGESVSADSYAREDDTRKGMAAPQITGSCVSYSAKYSLGLLMSVGTGQKDADSMDNRPQTQTQSRPQPPQTRPTPPPQPAQYQPPVQQAPVQQAPPAPQYQAPPMQPMQAPMQTAPQPPFAGGTAMTPPQPAPSQPIHTDSSYGQTAPTAPTAQPQQAPVYTGSTYGQSQTAPQQAPPFTRKERPAPPQPPISADAPTPVRPPVPAPGQYSTTKITPQSIPAEWDIPEVSRPEDLMPYEDEETPQSAGWMAIPDGVNEAELPFN